MALLTCAVIPAGVSGNPGLFSSVRLFVGACLGKAMDSRLKTSGMTEGGLKTSGMTEGGIENVGNDGGGLKRSGMTEGVENVGNDGGG